MKKILWFIPMFVFGLMMVCIMVVIAFIIQLTMLPSLVLENIDDFERKKK